MVERSVECARHLVDYYQDSDGESGSGMCLTAPSVLASPPGLPQGCDRKRLL